MPEMRFRIRWPDGSKDVCYSPSLVIKEYLRPQVTYPLDEFVERVRTALGIASERVQAKFGYPCSLALGQLKHIEHVAHTYAGAADAYVIVESFDEEPS